MRKCRRCSVVEGGNVGLRLESGAAGFSGLAKCGSVWACPVCSAKIARQRADDLDQVLSWAVREGHTVAMVTLTSRHTLGMRLRDCWNATTTAWGRVTSGRAWAGESDADYSKRLDRWAAKGGKRKRPVQGLGIVQRYGVLGFARAIEVTYGEHGWHVHIHAVIIFEGLLSPAMVTCAAEDMWPAWEKGLASRGFTALRDHGGLDVRVSTESASNGLAEYFTKFASLEVTGGVNKEGRGKGRTPFQLATAVFRDGDAEALDLWHEWEEASQNRRQLTWSTGLRELAGLAVELTDEEVAEEEVGDTDALTLPPETWAAMRHEQVGLLLAAESQGMAGAIRWLAARGLSWLAVPPGGPPACARRSSTALSVRLPVAAPEPA